jgi:hypothetical protein
MKLARDHRAEPLEIFDGLDPELLPFDPGTIGFDGYETIDLLRAADERYAADVALALGIDEALELRTLNKSSNTWYRIRGDVAISRSSTGGDALVILYTIFEAQPMRYHAYLHAVLHEN